MPTEREKAYLVKHAGILSVAERNPPKNIAEVGLLIKRIRELQREFPEKGFESRIKTLFFTVRDIFSKNVHGKTTNKELPGMRFIQEGEGENRRIKIVKRPKIISTNTGPTRKDIPRPRPK